MILDGAAIVNMIKPKSSKTFADYSSAEFIPYIKSQLKRVERLDVVWDQCQSNSLKCQTREIRELIRRRVSGKTAIPRNWNEFLRNSENKTVLSYSIFWHRGCWK